MKQRLYIIATIMDSLKRDAMFYLAAAISDFYVPWDAMVRRVHLLRILVVAFGNKFLINHFFFLYITG